MSHRGCDICRCVFPGCGAYWQQRETASRQQDTRRHTMYSPYIVEESQDRYQAQLQAREARRQAKQSRQAQRGTEREYLPRLGRAITGLQQRAAAWLMSGKAATPVEEIW